MLVLTRFTSQSGEGDLQHPQHQHQLGIADLFWNLFWNCGSEYQRFDLFYGEGKFDCILSESDV